LDDNYIELICCDDIYRPTDTEEEYELVKKNAKHRKTIMKSEIIGIEQVLNEYGNVRHSRTKLKFRYAEPIVAEIKYETLQLILFNNKHKYAGY